MTEVQFWSLISLAIGLWVGFCFGHLDGREKAYKYELKRFRSYTRRAQSILVRANEYKAEIEGKKFTAANTSGISG